MLIVLLKPFELFIRFFFLVLLERNALLMTHFQIKYKFENHGLRKMNMSQTPPCLYNCFLWFFIHILRQHNTKLAKRITQAVANTVYIRRNKMYFDCFPLSKYLPMFKNY